MRYAFMTHVKQHWIWSLGFVLAAAWSSDARADHCRQGCQKHHRACINACHSARARCIGKAQQRASTASKRADKSKIARYLHTAFQACIAQEARCQASCRSKIVAELSACTKACQSRCDQAYNAGKITSLKRCYIARCGVKLTTKAATQTTPQATRSTTITRKAACLYRLCR